MKIKSMYISHIAGQAYQSQSGWLASVIQTIIAKAHGGELKVESQEGLRTVFRIHLPEIIKQ